MAAPLSVSLLSMVVRPVLAAPSNYCDQFKTTNDCVYAPQPRCSWETSPGLFGECVCAEDDCAVFPICELEGQRGAAACTSYVLPNGARCQWLEEIPPGAVNQCTCATTNCTTTEVACERDGNCQDNCAWPCECAAGHCYTIDECWHFSDAECVGSMSNGQQCCNGDGGKGCFFCKDAPLCKLENTTAGVAGDRSGGKKASRRLPLGLTDQQKQRASGDSEDVA